MGLANLAKEIFERKKKLDASALKKSKPTRNPFVTSEQLEQGTILLHAPLSTQGRGIMGKLAQRAGKPSVKSFELEEVGAFVWNLCDGKNSFESIAKKLGSQFRLSRLESEASLTAFLQMLSQRKLITLMVASKK
ncbi:MAG TPA: PqqD family protein [Fimbriimonadaceae bacterium]|nr:PqqD family protein [Fimbriimonadaceae bacterium]